MPRTVSTRDSEVVARSVAAIGLVSIALIHLLDLQRKLADAPYQGYLFLVLSVVAVGAAGELILAASRLAWLIGALAGAGPLLGYVVSRTVGLPNSEDDIGNWLEPLGLASLIVEAVVLVVCLTAFMSSGQDRIAASRAGSLRRSRSAATG